MYRLYLSDDGAGTLEDDEDDEEVAPCFVRGRGGTGPADGQPPPDPFDMTDLLPL